MKILCVFENFYGSRIGRFRRPTYGLTICNRKNATYNRVIPFLEPLGILRFAETTPHIASNRHRKFEVDYNWVQRALDSDKWDIIIGFGKKACKVLARLNADFYPMPHPVSFQWRRCLIEELVEEIKDES